MNFFFQEGCFTKRFTCSPSKGETLQVDAFCWCLCIFLLTFSLPWIFFSRNIQFNSIQYDELCGRKIKNASRKEPLFQEKKRDLSWKWQEGKQVCPAKEKCVFVKMKEAVTANKYRRIPRTTDRRDWTHGDFFPPWHRVEPWRIYRKYELLAKQIACTITLLVLVSWLFSYDFTDLAIEYEAKKLLNFIKYSS